MSHPKGYKQTPEWSNNIRKALLGKKATAETKKKLSLAHLGKSNGHHSEETKRKIGLGNSLAQRGKKRPWIAGAKSVHWKGGVTPKNEAIRKSLEYRLWRKAVFERDDYTCCWCKERGGQLHADHIQPFAYFPDLRFAIDNGRTLCISCHKLTDTYSNRYKKLN